MKAISSILILFVSSCAIFDGYKDNEHSWYANALTPQEKDQIASRGWIYKDWYSYSKNGDFKRGRLMVKRSVQNPKKYNPVEIGKWEEEFHWSSGDFARGQEKRQTTYDLHGNIINRIAWNKNNRDRDFYKSANWSSEFLVINSDSILIQRVMYFHKNGQIAMDFKYAVPDFQLDLSDRLKKKYRIDTAYQYDNTGKILGKKFFNLIDSVKAHW